MRLRHLRRPHGRPWSGAFNVVMATAIISIACGTAGLDWLSIVFLWLAVAAFAPLALVDVGRGWGGRASPPSGGRWCSRWLAVELHHRFATGPR